MQGASLILTGYQTTLARALDVVANNVANSNTTGFKRQELKFDTYLMRPTVQDSFAFGIDKSTIRDIAPGPSLQTGNPFDLAIQGKGYFPIQTATGTQYSRSGAFVLNGQGQIVTPNGDKLLGDGDQPITIPDDASDILISADGVVSAKTAGNTNATELGKVKLVKFDREQFLQMVGNGLYTTTETPQPDTDSSIVQGMIEQSNVKAVTEITNMIDILRNYQTASRMLDNENQRLRDAINRLGKTSA